MVTNFKAVLNELMNITTLRLCRNGSNKVEKLFWATISLMGMTWFCYFINFQFLLWKDDGVIATKARIPLSDLEYPAVTFCPKSATKLGFVERIGNFIDSSANLKNEFMDFLKYQMVDLALKSRLHECLVTSGLVYCWSYENGDLFKENCLNDIPHESCKVG